MLSKSYFPYFLQNLSVFATLISGDPGKKLPPFSRHRHMLTQIFINLPVKDLIKTVEFFTKLGFKFNPQLTDENAN